MGGGKAFVWSIKLKTVTAITTNRARFDGILVGNGDEFVLAEGGNTHADWFAWEQTGGKIADGTTSGRGVTLGIFETGLRSSP